MPKRVLVGALVAACGSTSASSPPTAGRNYSTERAPAASRDDLIAATIRALASHNVAALEKLCVADPLAGAIDCADHGDELRWKPSNSCEGFADVVTELHDARIELLRIDVDNRRMGLAKGERFPGGTCTAKAAMEFHGLKAMVRVAVGGKAPRESELILDVLAVGGTWSLERVELDIGFFD